MPVEKPVSTSCERERVVIVAAAKCEIHIRVDRRGVGGVVCPCKYVNTGRSEGDGIGARHAANLECACTISNGDVLKAQTCRPARLVDRERPGLGACDV